MEPKYCMNTKLRATHREPSEAISAVMYQKLLNAESIDEYLNSNQDGMLDLSLADYLAQLLYQKDLIVADVIRDSGLTKSYVHQIFNGERRPARDKLIAIAFGLHLDLEETQRLLKLGGHSELYPRMTWDAVIFDAIHHGKSIRDVDVKLYERGYDTLLPRDD